MERFRQYLPDILATCWTQLELYCRLLRKWNSKVNLIARTDIDYLEEKHILPILPIITWDLWDNPSTVLDVGTGGGIPGIPLAILFPHTQFTLLDSIRKKVNVVQDIVQRMNLSNVQICNTRLEAWHQTYNAIVGRAVTAFDKFVQHTRTHLKKNNQGIFYWTGGHLTALPSTSPIKETCCFDLENFFSAHYCIRKKIFHARVHLRSP
ncbi:MAG: 16S rRNA (guanine(527)-N(7))-methyltransferase RsmG [Puniceicoccales bacterium]|jgi:16S rRNA (guanine527-N7)-methyltransferase|nr:16S rRNA (guanine(527)-N(7))-methyltransferase RsmG [Puniceicoccales bacterium]